MRFIASAAGLALLAACGTTAEQEPAAKKAFQEWLDATVSGDVGKHWEMLSVMNRSDWLFLRIEAGDFPARKFRAELVGAARTDLDLWLEFNRKFRKDRVDPLPGTVLNDPSLEKLYQSYFVPQKEQIKAQMSKLSISEVYADDSGATVSVRNAGGTTELYGLIVEGNGWKIDQHKPPLRAALPR